MRLRQATPTPSIAVSLQEVCEMLNISPRTAYRRMKDGLLRRIYWQPSPGKVYFLRADIEKILHAQVEYYDEIINSTDLHTQQEDNNAPYPDNISHDDEDTESRTCAQQMFM